MPSNVLDPLEQVVDLEVRVAIVSDSDLGALAEQRVGLVEQQHAVAALGVVEDLREVLLGLADPLADNRREVDLIEVEPELGGDHRCRERLAGARWPREQHAEAFAVRQLALEAPLLEHDCAMTCVVAHLAQPLDAIAHEHEVVPRGLGRDLPREATEPAVRVAPARLE